jgi:hypothetical protein
MLKPGIVDQDQYIRGKTSVFRFCIEKISADGAYIHQNLYSTHKGHFPVMFQQSSSLLLHQVATEKAEFRPGIINFRALSSGPTRADRPKLHRQSENTSYLPSKISKT